MRRRRSTHRILQPQPPNNKDYYDTAARKRTTHTLIYQYDGCAFLELDAGGGLNRTAPLLKQGQLAWISCGYRDTVDVFPDMLHPRNHGDARPIND